jgi:hypothetical protein
VYDTVAYRYPTDIALRLSADLQPRGSRIQNAVADGNILSRIPFGAFDNNAVIISLNRTIAYHHIATPVGIDSVRIRDFVATPDANAPNVHVGTTKQMHRPE